MSVEAVIDKLESTVHKIAQIGQELIVVTACSEDRSKTLTAKAPNGKLESNNLYAPAKSLQTKSASEDSGRTANK